MGGWTKTKKRHTERFLVVRVFGFVSTHQQLQQPSRRFLNCWSGTRRTKKGLGFLLEERKPKTILGRSEERAGIERKNEKIFFLHARREFVSEFRSLHII
jgi:hypothetical protein